MVIVMVPGRNGRSSEGTRIYYSTLTIRRSSHVISNGLRRSELLIELTANEHPADLLGTRANSI